MPPVLFLTWFEDLDAHVLISKLWAILVTAVLRLGTTMSSAHEFETWKTNL